MNFKLSLLFSLIALMTGFGQTSIEDIKIYNVWSSYDQDTGQWSEWEANDEVYILNYNGTSNIARCRLNNKIIIYKKGETPVKRGSTSSGHNYEEIKVTGEFFVPYVLRFYENNPDYGLELSTGRVKIRFAKM